MGEVYRARDTRLGREVAIKVLPQHLSPSPDVRARFEREAKLISSLNHPHICTLFDVGREGETDYLVMELVEGVTLADRLKRGPLTSAELLRFGGQIADAIDRAHRAGVIHRDLKPANVMLAKTGAKLMDFGLSRAAAGPAGGGMTPSATNMTTFLNSPTVAQGLTTEGTLLGTFQYMSPEQLEGHDADTRSDIWALGCVLYEMVTGRRAFEGRSQASLIAAILEREPAPVGEAISGSSVVDGPLPGIDRLIRNCLAKDPEERIQTAHDVKLQLQGIAETAGMSAASVASVAAPTLTRSESRASAAGARVAWILALLGLLSTASVFAWLYPQTQQVTQAVRFRLDAIPGLQETRWPRVSPDGKYILVLGTDTESVRRAYVRRIDQIDANPVPGTEELRRPYWSPDSREIVFVANDKIQRVPIGGGSPTTICAAQGGVDLSWGSKGYLLMDGLRTDSLRIVPAGGGELRPATRINRAVGETGGAWPCFLPDGEHFLFIGTLNNSLSGNIRLGKIGSLDSKLLGRSEGRVEYAPGGWVVFVRGGTLLAQKLDLGAGKLIGEPRTLVDGVLIGGASGHFSVSESGVLAVSQQEGGSALEFHAADRTGALADASLATGILGGPEPSPDGRRLLYLRATRSLDDGGDAYVLDLERATDTRLTFSGDDAFGPTWAPDGRRFAYATRRGGDVRLRIASAAGIGGRDSVAIPTGLGASLTQWSKAGSRLIFTSSDFRGHSVATDLPDRVPVRLLEDGERTAQQQISLDGRWIAYAYGAAPQSPRLCSQPHRASRPLADHDEARHQSHLDARRSRTHLRDLGRRPDVGRDRDARRIQSGHTPTPVQTPLAFLHPGDQVLGCRRGRRTLLRHRSAARVERGDRRSGDEFRVVGQPEVGPALWPDLPPQPKSKVRIRTWSPNPLRPYGLRISTNSKTASPPIASSRTMPTPRA